MVRACALFAPVSFDRCTQARLLFDSFAQKIEGEPAMEAQLLPLHLNLKDIEEKVRHVLRQVRRGDATAVSRWYSLDCEARTYQPRKTDIQYLIAREYGFKSWQCLKNRLNQSGSRDVC